MVKLGRGGMGGSRGRQKPRPLFPPGELPLFGPPPAYIRRPPGPPIPPARGPRAYGPPPQLPPPPPPMRPPHLGPPMPLPHHPMNMRRRPGPGPPPMPLLQAPPMPPRPAPFMRGPPMPRLGPGGKKLGKPMKRGKNKKNKNKPNTSKPEGEFFCEICDKSWDTSEELEIHKANHVSCEFDGCQFSAAPKLVALHVKLQHASGIFEKIVKSNNSEEIEKWKAERRRNYPTAENVEKKLAMRKEMIDRGERMAVNGNHVFKKKKGFSLINEESKLNVISTNKRHRRRKKKNIPEVSKNQFLSTVSLSEEVLENESKVTHEDDKEFSDEEWVRDEAGKEAKDKPLVSKALMALSMSYASDSEDDTGERTSENQQTPITDSSVNDDEAPAEDIISRTPDDKPNIHIDKAIKIESDCQKTTVKVQKRPLPDKKEKIEWKPPVKKRPLTLLEKLLEKEIRRERNYMLQCIRYIIKENFFDEKRTT